MAALVTPFIGIYIDNKGKRSTFIIISSLLIFLAHLMWLTYPFLNATKYDISPFFYLSPLILMGIFYSIYAAVLWACIPLIC